MEPMTANDTEMTTTGDKNLLPRIMQDDRGAFTQLYRHYFPRLYRYALLITNSPADAEEILQELFIKLWLKRNTLLPHVHTFQSYIFRMAHNMAFNYVSRQREVQTLDHAHNMATSEQADQTLIRRQYSQLLRDAIQQLSPLRRQVILLRLDSLSIRDIADKLEVSPSAIKKRLSGAYQALQTHLSPYAEISVYARSL